MNTCSYIDTDGLQCNNFDLKDDQLYCIWHQNGNNSNTYSKIQKLSIFDNITIILGANTEEPHIKQYQMTYKEETIVGITLWRLDEIKIGDRTLVLDFNNLSELQQLLPLKNKINKIIFDYSTFKFTTWNPKILALMANILKPGGQLFIDCYNSGGVKFAMNYMNDDHNSHQKYVSNKTYTTKKMYFDQEEPWYYEFFYYDYCPAMDKPLHDYKTEFEILNSISKIIDIPDGPEKIKMIAKIHNDYQTSIENLLLDHVIKINTKTLQAAGFSVQQYYQKLYPLISSVGPIIANYSVSTKL